MVPCRNCAKYLPQAISSIRAQSYQPEEIIVVDDCSSDNSVEIARSLGAFAISTPTNFGPSAARNLGVRTATGDIIAFLDADDYWTPEHLQRIAETFAKVPNASGVFARSVFFGTDLVSPVYDLVVHQPLNLRARLFASNVVPQSGSAVYRDCLLRCGGYDETLRYAEDYDLWMRLARTEIFAFSGADSSRYRVHPDQSTAGAGNPKLLQSAWSIRLRENEILRQSADPCDEKLCTSNILQGLQADFLEAWASRRRENIDFLLGVARRIPDSTAVVTAHHSRSTLLSALPDPGSVEHQ